MDKAQEKLQKDRIGLVVSKASYHQRVVIGAICANCLLSDNNWTATSDVYSKYCSMVSKDTKPLSYRRVSDLLVDLGNSGLVESRTVSQGRQGYGTWYKLKLSPYMVGPFVGQEWWDGIVKNAYDKKHTDLLFESLQNRGKKSSMFSNGIKLDDRIAKLKKKYGIP